MAAAGRKIACLPYKALLLFDWSVVVRIVVVMNIPCYYGYVDYQVAVTLVVGPVYVPRRYPEH